MEHPSESMYNVAPGAFGNKFRTENYEFVKQKTYLEWNPPGIKNSIDYNLYDRVDKYDIRTEN